MENYFKELNNINVNDKTENKNGLTYLSWAWAWAEFKKVYPEATYEVIKFNGQPYFYDPMTGYMCYTTVTVGNLTHEMWLPVMDGANKAMKDVAYTYKVKNPKHRYAEYNKELGKYLDKYGKEQPEYLDKTCEAATMFDINKTIMRCLTKNLAMFGLGLYIYAGEDLPEEENAPDKKAEKILDGCVSEPSVIKPVGEGIPAKSIRFTCADCGKALEPIPDSNGKPIPIRAHADKSEKMFGRVLCLDCIRKINSGN